MQEFGRCQTARYVIAKGVWAHNIRIEIEKLKEGYLASTQLVLVVFFLCDRQSIEIGLEFWIHVAPAFKFQLSTSAKNVKNVRRT